MAQGIQRSNRGDVAVTVGCRSNLLLLQRSRQGYPDHSLEHALIIWKGPLP